eukprot:11963.XXX_384556_384810_1 [CDS] Oithona nana genome sequencing.
MRQTRFLLQDDESLEQSPTLKNSSESLTSIGLSCTIHSYHTFQLQSGCTVNLRNKQSSPITLSVHVYVRLQTTQKWMSSISLQF